MGFFIVIVLAIVAFGAYWWWSHQKTEEAFQTLLTRDGLQPTSQPCGLSDGLLVMLRACPKGDRRHGLKHGVTGRVTATVAGAPSEVDCAAFVWWWEERQTHTDGKGNTTTSYSKRDRVVGAIALPTEVPSVSIAPEGLLTKFGIGGRGDFQLESEEFNRRFDVRVQDRDRALAIRLFDAQFQRFLLEMFRGRSIELFGRVLLVAGDPAGEDSALFGDIKELPGARRDAALIASRLPESFWRGLSAGPDSTGGAV